MVRFPEQDPRELPQFNETSTQQRWRSAQTKALTARRAWKTTQMTVSALCAPFKTFLMRQYGEDFVTVMTQEYEGTDITNPNSAAYNTHISVLTGPEQPERPPNDDPDYATKIAQYEVLVAEAKQYLGMQIPDVETATRIVNLVVKMEQYRRTAETNDSEALIHAIMSLAKGEPHPRPFYDMSPNQDKLGMARRTLTVLTSTQEARNQPRLTLVVCSEGTAMTHWHGKETAHFRECCTSFGWVLVKTIATKGNLLRQNTQHTPNRKQMVPHRK